MFSLTLESLSHMSQGLILLSVVLFCIWFVVLIRVLLRPDFDSVSRFMWVFILVSLNIFGLIAYAVAAPRCKLNPQPTTPLPQDDPPSPDYNFKSPI